MKIQKYMTPGIKEHVSILVQLYIWEILERYQVQQKKLGQELDYFQSFRLSMNANSQLEILHTEEVPNNYKMEYFIGDKDLASQQASEYLGLIFVIANEVENGYTMMLAREY